MTISHIVLNVSKLKESVEFYKKVLIPLGFSVADYDKNEFYRFTNGIDSVIVLSQVEKKYSDMRYHRNAVGLNHIAISVKTKEDVDKFETHLNNLEIKILGEGKTYMDYRKGYYALFFEDFDRIMIEVVWHDDFYFSKKEL